MGVGATKARPRDNAAMTGYNPIIVIEPGDRRRLFSAPDHRDGQAASAAIWAVASAMAFSASAISRSAATISTSVMPMKPMMWRM